LSGGDEADAQWALDASGLTQLSSDSAVLMRAVAGSLGIDPLDLPKADTPRLRHAEDIEASGPHTYLCERCTSPAKCRRRQSRSQRLYSPTLCHKGFRVPALDPF
jgi:hypothetical protein